MFAIGIKACKQGRKSFPVAQNKPARGTLIANEKENKVRFTDWKQSSKTHTH